MVRQCRWWDGADLVVLQVKGRWKIEEQILGTILASEKAVKMKGQILDTTLSFSLHLLALQIKFYLHYLYVQKEI